MNGALGATSLRSTRTAWLGWLKSWLPAWFLTMMPLGAPSGSGRRATTFCFACGGAAGGVAARFGAHDAARKAIVSAPACNCLVAIQPLLRPFDRYGQMSPAKADHSDRRLDGDGPGSEFGDSAGKVSDDAARQAQ